MNQGGKPEMLGEANRMLILNYLRLHGDMSRSDLSHALGISFPAISSSVKYLIDNGYVKELGFSDNHLGRKSMLVGFNEKRNYVIGIDLGRFKTRIMLADLAGKSVVSESEDTIVDQGEKALLDHLKKMIDRVVDLSGIGSEKIAFICIGTPGVICDDSIQLAPFLPEVIPSHIREKLSQKYNAIVQIENSVNLGAIGEQKSGAGRGISHFVFLNYGIGVGAAVIVDGKVYKGAHGAAGEIGYMIYDPARLRTEFDVVGDTESVLVHEKIRKFLDGKVFEEELERLVCQYKDGNLYSKMVLDEITLALGMSMINIASVLDVEAIIISGGMGANLGILFTEQWEAMLKAHVPYPPKVIISKLQNQEGVIGAVEFGIESLHNSQNKIINLG